MQERFPRAFHRQARMCVKTVERGGGGALRLRVYVHGTLFAFRKRAHGANPKGLAWEAKSINSSYLSNAINSILSAFPFQRRTSNVKQNGKSPRYKVPFVFLEMSFPRTDLV